MLKESMKEYLTECRKKIIQECAEELLEKSVYSSQKLVAI